MPEVLFQITDENLDTGLRGYPVGYCTTSTVDPAKGLHYIGVPVSEMAYWEAERVIYLLFYGKDPSPEELTQFKKNLQARSKCNPKVIEHIQQLPREGHPMKLFCAALLICGMYEGLGDYKEDCLNLIAKIPEVTAAAINFHAGWGPNKPCKPELGYIENFAHMLNVPNCNPKELTEVFRLFAILHFDHGGGNLSTFVGKAVASGLEDIYGSICAAMCALAGPRHGRANQECLEFAEVVLQALGENVTAQQVENYLREKLAKGELLYGFGHAVLRVEDPRASVLYTVAAQKYPTNPLVKITRLLRSEGPKVLKENPKISNPYPNVDAISGTLLTAAGFPYPHYYTVLFGLARTVGIALQIVYERCEAREGKGTPIVRPKYLYKAR